MLFFLVSENRIRIQLISEDSFHLFFFNDLSLSLDRCYTENNVQKSLSDSGCPRK
jgi:hypothetical protein